MAASAEYERTKARQSFNQAKWALINAITGNEGIINVEKRFNDLTTQWLNARHKHVHLSTVSSERGLKLWLNELEVEFTNAKREKTKYILNLDSQHEERLNETRMLKENLELNVTRKLKENLELNETRMLKENLEYSKPMLSVPIDKGIAQFRRSRDIEEHSFISAVEDLSILFLGDDDTITSSSVRIQHNKIQNHFEKWREAQNNYISLLNVHDANLELDWTKVIQTLYAQTNTKIAKYLEAKNTGRPISSIFNDSSDSVWLDRNRLPLFKGDIQSYPRFKSKFNNEVLPMLSYNCSTPYVLKCCLWGEPRDIVKNDDDIEVMWSKLDKRYGLWDLVVKDFHKSFQDISKRKSVTFSEDITGNRKHSYGDVKQINNLTVRYPILW